MPDEWTLTQLIHAIAEFTVGLLCIFSNTLVLLAMYRNKSLRTVTYCFMASLALSDLLVGIAVPPLVILAHQGWPPDFHGCVLINSLVILFTNISIFTMFDVTFDRYMAICHPVFHRRKMTITRAKRLLAVSWIVAIVLGLVPVMGWNNGKENFEGTCSFVAVISMKYMVYMMFLGVNVPLLVVMLTVYTYVFYVIRRVRKKTQKRSPAAVIEKGGKRIITKARGVMTMFVVVFLYAICWLPIYVLYCIALLSPGTSLSSELFLFTIVLSHAHSFMNPIVYSCRHRQLRKTYAEILGCRRAEREQVRSVKIRLSLFTSAKVTTSGVSLSKSRGTSDISDSVFSVYKD